MATHPLVGKVLKGTKIETPYTFPDGTVWNSVGITLDQSEVDMLINTFGDNLRIQTPGSMVTADCDECRVNVYVDEDFTITEVSNG